jgi:outer membrane lipoprotein-sorting protein
MNPLLKISRRARWAVPAGVVAITAGVTAGSMISVAQAAPELPARSPAQLLAAVAGHSGPPPALTGTVVETAALGVPQLPGAGNPNSITALLAGSHTIRVWYSDPTHIRLAIPVSMSETDVIRNGSTVWLWQSQSNTVTRKQLPAKASQAEPATPLPVQTPLTPQQAAQQVLAAVGPTTTVSVDPAVTVAGQAAYELVLAPKSSSSLVGKVTVALDGQHSDVPLRVQVFARGARTPAFQVGYTTVAFVKPAAANFNFTPPAGAKVTTDLAGTVLGQFGYDGSAPVQRSSSAQKQVPRLKVRAGKLEPGTVQSVTIPLVTGHASKTVSGEQTLGKDWLSVAVLPAGAVPGLSGAGNAAGVVGQAAQGAAGGSAAVSGSGQDAAILGALLSSATPVHGAWGSGRLLHTSLVSILMLDNGKVLVGAVTPSVLYSDAAQVK